MSFQFFIIVTMPKPLLFLKISKFQLSHLKYNILAFVEQGLKNYIKSSSFSDQL